jgi:hypothetical protein
MLCSSPSLLQIARTHLHCCRTSVSAQMCARRSRPSNLNPLTIKIGPHIFLNRVPFDGARRGPWAFRWRETGALGMYGRGSRGPTRHVFSICSVVRTRDRVAGAGYVGNARPDLHTVCRSFPKISSALSAKFCGGSKSATRPSIAAMTTQGYMRKPLGFPVGFPIMRSQRT